MKYTALICESPVLSVETLSSYVNVTWNRGKFGGGTEHGTPDDTASHGENT